MVNILLRDLVSISPAYHTEVNILADFEDRTKVEGYLPNKASQRVLSEIVLGVMPTSTKRVHLLTGQYGTGKSHFGLILAALARKLPETQLLFDKLHEKNKDGTEKIERLLSAVKKYLVVVPDIHDYVRGFDRMLLIALEEALSREEIDDFRPQSAFREAEQVIIEWKDAPAGDDNPYRKLKNYLLQHHGIEPEALIGRLQRYSDDEYQIFKKAYSAVTYGAIFSPNIRADPKEIYKETIEYLRSTGKWEGIWLICDEFGRYLTRIAQSPSSDESQNIQQFAEHCKRTQQNQCHFTLIAHQSLDTYAAGLRSEEDWIKISGRFTPDHSLENIGDGYEEIEMISTIVLQRKRSDQEKKTWSEISNHKDISLILDDIGNANLFSHQEYEKHLEMLIVGCFPLHPFTSYCLPWLARNLGQRERTLFTFFNDNSDSGLRQFINRHDLFDEDGHFNLYTADRLIDYFAPSATSKTRSSLYKQIVAARDEALRDVDKSALARRIINILAIFELVGPQNIEPTEQNIVAGLYLSQQQSSDVPLILHELTNERRTIRRRANGHYELRHRSGFDLQDTIREEKKRLRAHFDVITALKSLPSYSDRLISLLAEEYKQKHFMTREAGREIVTSGSLSNPQRFRKRIDSWYQPKRRRYVGDVLILYILVENEQEINDIRHRLLEDKFQNPQLVFAVPKKPWPVTEKLLQLKSLQEVKANSSSFKDMTDADLEELNQSISDQIEVLDRELMDYLYADNLIWYCNGNITSNLGRREESAYISNILEERFNKTPRIQDDAIVNIPKTGRDSQKTYRHRAINTLLQTEGFITISNQGGNADERILRTCLGDTEVLEKKRDRGSKSDYEVREEWPKYSELHEIWLILSKHLMKSDTAGKFDETVIELLNPPFGLSNQLVEVVLAAFFRNRLDEYAFVMRSRSGSQLVGLDAKILLSIVESPLDYGFMFYEVRPEERDYVRRLITQVSSDHELSKESGIWKQGRDILVGWAAGLPMITLKAAKCRNEKARPFLDLLLDSEKTEDEKELLKTLLPDMLKINLSSPPTIGEVDSLMDELEVCLSEIEDFAEEESRILVRQLTESFGESGATQGVLNDAMQKWHLSLNESQQLHSFRGNAGYLQKAVESEESVPQRMLIDLPKAMGLNAFEDWEDLTQAQLYIAWVKIAKQEIESWRPEPIPIDPDLVPDPSEKEQTKQSIMVSLSYSGLSVSVQRQILQDILAELIDD